MFSHLTVPVDGSRFAESAIPYATSIARRVDACIELVIVEEAGLPPRLVERVDTKGERVVVAPPAAAGSGGSEPAGAAGGEAEPGESRPGTRVEPERSAESHYVTELAAATREATGLQIEAAVLAGRPVAALVEHIGRTGTSLVVMATHGRGAFSRFWLGSVADELARTINAPLLLVRPPSHDEPVPSEITIKEVLVPLDGSTHAEEVLMMAAPLAASMDARLTLLRVAAIRMLAGSPIAPDMIQIDEVGLEAERAQAEQYLESVAARLRHRGFAVRTAVVDGMPAQDIIGYATENDVDLIAMSTHGYGGLRRFLIGSVADKVLRGTDRPMLLYRPTGTG